MPTLAVLTAAGSGTRLGLDLPKALVELDGLPLVVHAARRLCASGAVDAVVVTAPPGLREHVATLLRDDPAVDRPVRVVEGAGTRQASVAAGLRAGLDRLPGDAADGDPRRGAEGAAFDVVLVHDAARPLAPPSLVRRVVEAVRSGHGAVVPGLPVTDTIKRVTAARSDDPSHAEPVAETVDRAVLRAVQTPQGFDRALLVRAHEAAAHRADDERSAATDDAGLVEALGLPVHVVPGDAAAAKITTAHDLRVAALTLREER
ncbi:2-C-methyl-D-erythritol 4-phosphate cytidylyltransferase [Cellulosimicrobium protaetiae]|uniref:2-C-methyl-D-erythritol 4-phosphate cytidylyltransferase n=1 Tax=Cellulosimicrobium protaetiae TaxID=2587808 RepID=A0A6M5UCK1_9MICO|nr:2-C-methyl-D-erythritol 4-phosphate cytidylyltransferase [Cellulosimicrobium protaetiae]QJW35814.1 2-C-methyl-D-erythritol 4-phosphate cytidylyltransferase [Cellulosimicrobium protaetiae]